VVHRQVKGGFELMVGEAGLTRRETPQCRILGPTWGERAGSAFDSLAFGLEEVEAEVAGLLRRGLSLFGRPCVEPLIPSHDSAQAALLCSQAITAYFWRLSEWNKNHLPLHCRNLPAMTAAFDPTARMEDVCHVELLQQSWRAKKKSSSTTTIAGCPTPRTSCEGWNHWVAARWPRRTKRRLPLWALKALGSAPRAVPAFVVQPSLD
jgi:hypothetical protein